jgi:hypothetical protein
MATDTRRQGHTSVAPDAQTWERSAADWEWLRTHPEVLAEHAGRWICVLDRQIVVSELDDAAFHQQLQRGGYLAAAPLVMRVPLPAEWQEVRLR